MLEASDAKVKEGKPSHARECVVCFDRDVSHIFVPCGHQCVCERCAATVMATSCECPICRGASHPVRESGPDVRDAPTFELG